MLIQPISVFHRLTAYRKIESAVACLFLSLLGDTVKLVNLVLRPPLVSSVESSARRVEAAAIHISA